MMGIKKMSIKKMLSGIKSLNGKQLAILTVCFAFVLTVIAGVIGSGEFSLGYKSADTATNFKMKSGSGIYAAESAVNDEIDAEVSSEETEDGLFQPAVDSAVTRVVTKKATLYIETENYEKLMDLIESKVEELYGYIETDNEYDYSSQNTRSAYITARVPAESLDTFISALENGGTIRTQNITRDDITSDYAETESHITALEAEEVTLLDLLSKAQSLSDTIQIQERLTSIRADLRYYEDMMACMENEVAYSSVTLNIDEVDHAVASGSGFWYEIKTGFVESLYDIADGFKIMAIWFISALPFVVMIIVCVIIVKCIVKAFKNKKGGRGESDAREDIGGQTDS